MNNLFIQDLLMKQHHQDLLLWAQNERLARVGTRAHTARPVVVALAALSIFAISLITILQLAYVTVNAPAPQAPPLPPLPPQMAVPSGRQTLPQHQAG